MIPAYSPQARGRSERNFGTWQGRLPQELRLAGITTVEERQRVSARALHRGVQREVQGAGGGEGHGVSPHRAERSELDLHGANRAGGGQGQHGGDRRTEYWQIGEDAIPRARWPGCTVTIHEHLDGTGVDPLRPACGGPLPGRRLAAGSDSRSKRLPKSRGKGGAVEAVENQKPVSHRSHRPLEISPTTRDSHFPTAATTTVFEREKNKKPRSASRRG